MAEGLLETRVETVSADEIGQLAASFNRMAEGLHDLIKRERDFVAAVSHELRTPLAALNVAGEVLTRYREAIPPEGREALDLLGEDLVALRQLVEDLMEISQLDARKVSVRAEEVHLKPFVEALLARRQRVAPVTGPAARITTDKARLERIIGNLVDNAFTHGDGRNVAVRIFDDNGSCGVTVSDRGPGIDHSELPLVFGRFYKTDRSRTRERGGVGLGLAIAAENARVLGGRLDVVSEPGGGAAFTVTLSGGSSVEGDR
jgi:two-component system sensor histidine kinase MtrB